MYSISYIQNPKFVIQTKCKVKECMSGGLSKVISSSTNTIHIQCIDKQVQRQECSFIKSNPMCNNLIGKYHVINDKGTILETFANNLNLQTNNNNSLNSIVNWLQSGMLSLITILSTTAYNNLSTFWNDLNACIELVKDELQKRQEHLHKCVCLSNEGHSLRIKLLENIVQLFEGFMQNLIIQICINDNVFINSSNLNKFYVIFKYTNINQFESYKQEFQAEINNVIKMHKLTHTIVIDHKGDVKMDGALRQLIVFKPLLKKLTSDAHYVEHYIQRLLKTALESAYYSIDVFNHNETPFATCVELNANNDIIKVKMNYKEVSNYLSTFKKFDVDPSFLASFIEEHNKLLIYKNCFFALIKYQIDVVKKLCKNLNTIDMDDDIRDLLINICTMINGNGKNQKGIGWLFKPEMESRIKEMVPRLNTVYKSLLSSEKASRVFKDSSRKTSFLQKDPSYKATYDILKDLKHMKEHFIVELFMMFEEQWKNFEQEFYTQPNTQQKKKKLKSS